jgi:hypothetical protein
MIDLPPAADTVARIVGGVRDDQLTASTPCTESTIGELIDHVDGLSLAFTAAAHKTPLPGGSQAGDFTAAEWINRLVSEALG